MAELLAWHTGITVRQAMDAVTQLMQVFKTELLRGREIELKGLGFFIPKTNPPRRYGNPRTGTVDTAPWRIRLKFRPNYVFNDIYNKALNPNGGTKPPVPEPALPPDPDMF